MDHFFIQLFKFILQLTEELKAEIETQKAMFYLQQQEREEGDSL